MNDGVISNRNEISAPKRPSNEKTQRYLRILIAEDDPINQRVLLGMLSLVPCDCDVVDNGAEATAALMRSPYDLVLMDIQMPVMDGIVATLEIRKIAGRIGQVPIIAVTANAMQGDREKYLAAGMNDYISKPIKIDDLVAAIQRCTGVAELAITPGCKRAIA